MGKAHHERKEYDDAERLAVAPTQYEADLSWLGVKARHSRSPSPSPGTQCCMNEFEILIRHFHGIATHPFHFAPGYHEVGRWAGFIVHDQISRSDLQVNVSRRAGTLLYVAVKLPVRTGLEAATVHKATYERAFEGEKRDYDE
jgi:hypothetical protein